MVTRVRGCRSQFFFLRFVLLRELSHGGFQLRYFLLRGGELLALVALQVIQHGLEPLVLLVDHLELPVHRDGGLDELQARHGLESEGGWVAGDEE